MKMENLKKVFRAVPLKLQLLLCFASVPEEAPPDRRSPFSAKGVSVQRRSLDYTWKQMTYHTEKRSLPAKYTGYTHDAWVGMLFWQDIIGHRRQGTPLSYTLQSTSAANANAAWSAHLAHLDMHDFLRSCSLVFSIDLC